MAKAESRLRLSRSFRFEGWVAERVVVLPIILAVFAFFPQSSAGQFVPSREAETTASVPGSHLEVYLMTMGPGDPIWARFSHNALVIRDSLAGTEIAYNWGMFDFSDADFIARLARGRMRYWMAGYRSSDMVEVYRRENRDVWIQRVNLAPGQRLELAAFLRDMDTDANRYYQYDYYRDNCSTRVRDALDLVLGGQIRSATAGIATDATYRWHTARLLRPVLAGYLGIQFVVGNRGDRPISAWDEMFLPLYLQRHLGDVRVTAPDGASGPLLGPVVHVVASQQRDAVPSTAPSMLVGLLIVGGLAGGMFVLLGRSAGAGKRWARWCLALVGSGWSLVMGLLGSALILSWMFTDHFFWGLNENAFQANPASLVLAPLLLAAAAGWRHAWVVRTSAAVAALALIGVVVQVLPGFDQTNGEILALAVPVHLGLAWGVLKAWPTVDG